MSDDIVARLRANGGLDAKLHCEAADEIERLRSSLDNARRVICCQALPPDYKTWDESDIDYALKLIAAQQGWECFK